MRLKASKIIVWTIGLFLFAILVAVFLPVVQSGPIPGPITTAMINGRNIYVSAFAAGLEKREEPMAFWASTEQFDNSTEFLRSLVTREILNVDYSFFGGPKMRKSKTFSSENNAWCVVANVDEHFSDGTPIMFTRNINITNLNQLTGPMEETFSDEKPFGKKIAVIVQNGGAATTVRPEGTWEDHFKGAPFGDHPVLRP